jgi:CRISPR-associated protein Cas5d
MSENIFTVRVWGDYACFTRPEMKVERVSYPLPTPSAARGILEAIYWEPQMYYLIDSIHVLKKRRWINFRRNEVSNVVSLNDVQKWMKGTKGIGYIEAGGGARDSAQRNMLALADVEYLITAEVRTSARYRPERNDQGKYLREIKDRAAKGKCHHRPALGCREFAADFELVEDRDVFLKTREMEQYSEDLGLMLYDVFDPDEREEGFRWLDETELAEAKRQREEKIKSLPKKDQKKAAKEPVCDYEGQILDPMATFFHATVENSRMDCHPERIKIIKPKIREGERHVIASSV